MEVTKISLIRHMEKVIWVHPHNGILFSDFKSELSRRWKLLPYHKKKRKASLKKGWGGEG